MKQRDILFSIPAVTPEEMMYLETIIGQFDEDQVRKFVLIYSSKRKKSQEIMLFTLLGFFGVAGVQRVMLEQIAMGILYFLTLGFCFIGTIVDLINYQSLTEEYNRKTARECAKMVMMRVY